MPVVRSSVGILTNSRPSSKLAQSDAWPRWWGVSRHRFALGLGSVVLGADASLRPGSRAWEWILCALALAAAAPGPGSRTLAEYFALHVRYLLRRRVWWITLEHDHDALLVDVGASQRVWCYEFLHRGRLDLNGQDALLAARLARMAESLANGGVRAHVAVHVDTGDWSGTPPRTTLSVSTAARVPSEWRQHWEAGVPRHLDLGRTALIERRHYVRTPRCVVRTLRVADFSSHRAESVLESLARYGSRLAISLHAEVLPARRAQKLTARAVHRTRSDAQFTLGAGFRWSARDQLGLDSLRDRETLVAEGAALCQWALYVVVSAASVSELRLRVHETREVARAAGLHLESGWGVQAEWFAYQLPGGTRW